MTSQPRLSSPSPVANINYSVWNGLRQPINPIHGAVVQIPRQHLMELHFLEVHRLVNLWPLGRRGYGKDVLYSEFVYEITHHVHVEKLVLRKSYLHRRVVFQGAHLLRCPFKPGQDPSRGQKLCMKHDQVKRNL